MARIGVLGAEGFLGGLVVEALDGHGADVLPLGGATLVADADRLHDALAGCDLVVSAIGVAALTRQVLEAALATGTHLLDPVGDPTTLSWALERDGAAREAGVTVVLAAGFVAVPGDPLAHLAAHAVSHPDELHVTYAFPGGGGLLGAVSGGTRRAFADALGAPAVSLVRREQVEEGPGEARRLAWFPRPVGPVHAAGVPAPEPLTVPRHVPAVGTVRTYLALSSWRAELLQAAGTVAHRARGRRLLASRLTARSGPPTAARRANSRWACVAEAQGEGGIARAWAYGTDPYGTSAASLTVLADAVLAGRAAAGVVPPSLVEVPGDMLDALSACTDLRWSISRPG